MKNSAALGGCYPPRSSVSVDNTLLDLQNSSYPTQPHSIIANYSMSPSWIWSDKITNERGARVGYNHFISNKGQWNNCFSKFSNRVLPPIYIPTILQSVQKEHTTSGHAPRLPPSPDYYITKSWMKVTATQTTICRQLVAKTKLLFNRSNTR